MSTRLQSFAIVFGAMSSLLAASACHSAADRESSDTAHADAPYVYDPTVPVVVNSRADITSAPQLHLHMEWRVGQRDASATTQFGAVTHMSLGPDSSLYVLDAVNHTVTVFDTRNGRTLRAFGNRGAGPAEFQRPVLIGTSSDTILVLEGRRFHVFTPQGNGLTSMAYSRELRTSSVAVRGVRHSAAGWMVIVNSEVLGGVPHGNPFRDTMEVRMLNAATGELGEALPVKMPGPVRFLFQDIGWLRQRYMASYPHMSVSEAGTIYATTGDEYIIQVFREDGSPIRYVKGDVERTPVTESEFLAVLAEERSRYPLASPGSGEDGSLAVMLRDDAHKVGFAPFRPVLGRILTTPHGDFLVERIDSTATRVSTGEVRWDLIGADGRIRGFLITPPRVRLRIFSGNAVIATVLDEFDVASIARFRLDSTGAG